MLTRRSFALALPAIVAFPSLMRLSVPKPKRNRLIFDGPCEFEPSAAAWVIANGDGVHWFFGRPPDVAAGIEIWEYAAFTRPLSPEEKRWENWRLKEHYGIR